ncbi:MAG: ankyrin repeat domain-containing protein [Rickettsiales bacterium]
MYGSFGNNEYERKLCAALARALIDYRYNRLNFEEFKEVFAKINKEMEERSYEPSCAPISATYFGFYSYGGITTNPLNYAVMHGLYEVVELFYSQSIGKEWSLLKLFDSKMATALMFAVCGEDKKSQKIVDFLLEKYQEEDLLYLVHEQKNFKGVPALIDAAISGNLEAIQKLSEIEGIDINHQNRFKETALMVAIRDMLEEDPTDERVEAVSRLLEIPGIKVNIYNIFGTSAPMIAESQALRIGKGSNAYKIAEKVARAWCEETEATALELDDSLDETDVHKLDLKEGESGEPETSDEEDSIASEPSRSKLMIAAAYAYKTAKEVARYWFKETEVTDLESGDALAETDVHKLDLKEGEGGELETSDEGDSVASEPSRSKLMIAVEEGSVLRVNILLEMGVDINEIDHNGLTAFDYAKAKGYTDIADILLRKGSETPAYVEEGFTDSDSTGEGEESGDDKFDSGDKLGDQEYILILAARHGNVDQVKDMLLVEGININAQDEHGRTALENARMNNHAGVVEVLERAIADEGEGADGIHEVRVEARSGAAGGVEMSVDLLLNLDAVGGSSTGMSGVIPDTTS